MAVLAAAAGIVLLAGCLSVPATYGSRSTAAVEPEGPTSLLDLKYATMLAPSLAEAGASEQASSARLTSPTRYRGVQVGRTTSEALPQLPPLPKTEIWRPTSGGEKKPELKLDASQVKVQHRPPVPGLEELFQEGESAAKGDKASPKATK